MRLIYRDDACAAITVLHLAPSL